MASSEADRPIARVLRQSTFIVPSTGERVRRVFSLREASRNIHRQNTGETDPLLQNGRRPSKTAHLVESTWSSLQYQANKTWRFAQSSTGQGVLKCSLAYLLGSLATFIPAIADRIGRGDSKHIVATVTVWFHPARTVGSMHEGAILAFFGFCYAAFISLTSMAVSMFFANQGLLQLGHLLVLVIFCGGGLGFIAWTKLHFGHPLVNVACSLASLGSITTLVKEGSIQGGTFSAWRITQILVMVLMGIIIVTLVNILILPIKARSRLHKDIARNTEMQGEMLINIARAFLVGEESILQEGQDLSKEQTSSLVSMTKNLVEAQREYYVHGREKQYGIELRLAKCLTKLSHNLGGLRSAASTQFGILGEGFGSNAKPSQASDISTPTSPSTSRPNNLRNGSVSRATILDVITEDDEEPETVPQSMSSSWFGLDGSPSSPALRNTTFLPTSPSTPSTQITRTTANSDRDKISSADMFAAFINQLGPPAKSLAYTLKQILDIAPFNRDGSVNINEQFHPSLERAVELYKQSRKDALESLYKSKALNSQRSSEVLADLEEVAASCGHFSFSLLDFAEEALSYLDLLNELKSEIERSPRRRSWNWMMFWRHRNDEILDKPFQTWQDHEESGQGSANIPAFVRKIDDFARPLQTSQGRPWTYGVYRALRILRRDDVRFAIKVGVGAALYALPAYLPESRPAFHHFRGEWGLVSYMVVCSMTIGASNTTGFERFLGTLIGAGFAVVAWLISNNEGQANPYLLAFFGWLVSLGCFYLILAKGRGPMGRFVLLTYNLGALYAYSLSVQDDDNDDDEGGIDPAIWEIVYHRAVSVFAGCLWAIIITRFIWPISARNKLKDGMCVLWLRMSLIWKRDPLAMFLLGEPKSSYMDIREEAELQSFLTYLDSLRQAAKSEFELRGPFPDQIYKRIVDKTRNMLDSFHAMNVVISKDMQCSPGEAAILSHTRPERFALSARISHLFSVLASSLKLEYPLNDVLPNIQDRRDRLLTKLFEFRRSNKVAVEADFELLYAYVLVTGQLAQDIEAVIHEIEMLFGTLDEENLKLQ